MRRRSRRLESRAFQKQALLASTAPRPSQDTRHRPDAKLHQAAQDPDDLQRLGEALEDALGGYRERESVAG
jgi:hypothetical protein